MNLVIVCRWWTRRRSLAEVCGNGAVTRLDLLAENGERSALPFHPAAPHDDP
jgi:hypothetical protein